MNEEQRATLGIPPPPPPYEPISTDLVRQAIKRTERESLKVAAISTAVAAAVYVPLYLLVGVYAAVASLTLGPVIDALVRRWWMRRRS